MPWISLISIMIIFYKLDVYSKCFIQNDCEPVRTVFIEVKGEKSQHPFSYSLKYNLE